MDSVYAHNTQRIFDCFHKEEALRNYIVKAISENLGSIVNRFNPEKLLTLCNYVLYELSEFLCGFVYQGIHYNLCVYSGSITSLTRDLLQQDFFQPIYAQFVRYGTIAHAEMYACVR